MCKMYLASMFREPFGVAANSGTERQYCRKTQSSLDSKSEKDDAEGNIEVEVEGEGEGEGEAVSGPGKIAGGANFSHTFAILGLHRSGSVYSVLRGLFHIRPCLKFKVLGWQTLRKS